MEENRKQTPYDEFDAPHEEPASEENDELTPEEMREAIEMYKRFKQGDVWNEKPKNDEPADDIPEDEPWKRPQEPPFYRPHGHGMPPHGYSPFEESVGEDDDLPPWQHDHFDPPPYRRRRPHGPHEGFGVPPFQGGFRDHFGERQPWPEPPFSAPGYRPGTVPPPPFGFDPDMTDTRPWPPVKTNRYAVRTSGLTGVRNVEKFRVFACVIWILGLIGAILTACFAAHSFASAVLIIFWVLAGAGVLGALLWWLCEPLSELLNTCDFLQNMYVEQTEFAEEQDEP